MATYATYPAYTPSKKTPKSNPMHLQANPIALFLLTLTALGIFSHNNTITIPAAILLLMQQTLLARYLPWVEKYGITLGIIILTIGVLAPLASGKIKITNLQQFLNSQMLIAIGIGILVAWLGGRGVPLMRNIPTLVPGLIIGTIIGVACFRGVPVGPLIAAGILSLLIGLGEPQ